MLLEINKEIDIHSKNDYAFRNTCLQGHLNKSFNKKFDIHADHDDLITWTRKRRHLEVAKWLLTLDYKINLYPYK